MVELPDWLSPFFVFQKSSKNAWHLIHCLKSWHLIRGYNLTHILQWICSHIRKPIFFRSLASNPNLQKSPETRRFLALDFIFLTSRLLSLREMTGLDWCLVFWYVSFKLSKCNSCTLNCTLYFAQGCSISYPYNQSTASPDREAWLDVKNGYREVPL